MSTASGVSDTVSPMSLAEGGRIQGFADRFNEIDHHLVVLGDAPWQSRISLGDRPLWPRLIPIQTPHRDSM